MRELRVEDALLYLDLVKVEFGDRPHIYNEFLDIMKTFKTQQIDTPGVIRRVSNLFKGNRKLVLGFNTFLPEGYKIELPLDGDGPPVAVYRAPGSNVAQVLREGSDPPSEAPMPRNVASIPPHMQQSQQVQQNQHQQHIHMPQRLQPQAEASYGHAATLPPTTRVAPQGGMIAETARVEPRHAAAAVTARPSPPGPLRAIDTKAPPLRVLPRQQQQQAQQTSNQVPSVPPSQPPPRAMPGFDENGAPQQQGPMEFDHAINYVTTIKKRFASEPETYKRFLEILHTYQKEQRGIKEVLDEVSTLFADHPDLLKEFTYFLPDAVQAQAKAQLDQVAKEAEARKRNQAKQAIMTTAQNMQKQVKPRGTRPADLDRNSVPVPFGAKHGRTTEREKAIISEASFGVVSFDPVRPPRKSESTPAQAALKRGRPVVIPEIPHTPNTFEAGFFQRAKEHLLRRELSAERTSVTKRHTPYTEFLKCLHLYGAGVLNRDELLLLLKGLFMQGHAPKSGTNASGSSYNSSVTQDANELLRDFQELLVSRGPFADQEAAHKMKSKYGVLRIRDIDFGISDVPTPSYRWYPADYPKSLLITHSGQSEMDVSVLNKNVVSVAATHGTKRAFVSIEESDAVRNRKNAYEEAMFRIEDERYELDMAIERNFDALRHLEPHADEAKTLREQEEKDGQPIGRLQYKLNHYTMNSIHINAIARVYGDRGDEVLQHLVRNPLISLPIVYERLKQKDAEWRKAKADIAEKWNLATEANYEGSLDVQCYFKRRRLEHIGSVSRLIDECKRARVHARDPESSFDKVVPSSCMPVFGLQSKNPSAILYQPFLAVKCKIGHVHKDAFDVISKKLASDPSISAQDRERIGRIWAEFFVPWFGYPPHWVQHEVRSSFRGKVNHNVVKYALGQRVMTIYGEGTILSFAAENAGRGPHYRIRLPFGIAFISPSAVLYTVVTSDVTYVRRDGAMEKEKLRTGSPSTVLGGKHHLLFGTENIYLLMRYYVILCNLLSEVKQPCEQMKHHRDPSVEYYNPSKKRSSVAEALSYTSLIAALSRVNAKDIELKEFEALGRKVSPEQAYVIAALPKFVQRCAEALVKVAREDVLLHLFDFCHQKLVDPPNSRMLCISLAPDVFYRIQYDTSNEEFCFCYLPVGSELFIAPHDDNADNISEDGKCAMDTVETEEQIDEYDDSSDQSPPNKRLKLK